MNALHIGFQKDILLPKGGFLFIGDDIPTVPRARIFDPLRHSLNPLKNIDYKKARELADALYAIYPQGENTLTVRQGRRALLQTLLNSRRFDKTTDTTSEVKDLIDDLVTSPVLRRVFCNPTNFSFSPTSTILARISRRELGDFDALVLGLLLINHFKGQLVIPDFGFYGRDAHTSLIRENRLVAGVDFLAELPTRLRHAALLIEGKVASHAHVDDAETLAKYAGLSPGTNAYNAFIEAAIS
jgi:hypothetical protein